MITFKYTNEQYDEYGAGTKVEVTTGHEHLEKVVEMFKTFLLHLGHHPDNIERITFEEKTQGLPVQLDFFAEER